MHRFVFLVLFITFGCSGVAAQTTPAPDQAVLAPPANGSMTDLEVDTLYRRGVALMAESKWAEALPLIEKASEQRPGKGLYAEQLGRCLVGRAGGLDGSAKLQARKEAYQAFLRARNLGDNSNLVQIMLEQLGAVLSAGPETPKPATPYSLAINDAEKAFNGGDFAGSISLYEKAMALDPHAYEAPLFAGDAAYKAGRYPDAFRFYAMAVAINPNRETAYRYWGDTLMKAGQPAEAESRFIDAVVAQPYIRTSQIGLRQWAQLTNHVFAGPEIHLPKPTITQDANGGLKLAVVPGKEGDPNSPLWITYQVRQMIRFLPAKVQPDGKPARRSLVDEAAAIRATLQAAQTQKVPDDKLDPSLKTLRELDRKGMLESWILLFDADADIAQDYDAYRDAHRALVGGFIREYAIHEK